MGHILIDTQPENLGSTKHPGKPQSREGAQRAPVQDLREWLARIEKLGELIRIGQPVSRDEEMSAVSHFVAKQLTRAREKGEPIHVAAALGHRSAVHAGGLADLPKERLRVGGFEPGR